MAWRKSNLTLRMPLIPNYSFGDTFWVGTGADAGYFLFQLNGKWVISASFGPSFAIGGVAFTPVYLPVNGYVYWSGGNGLALWYDGTWVITANPGYGTTEEWSDDNGKYTGDAWYSAKGDVYVGRGSLRGTVQDAYNGPTLAVTSTFDYWLHSGSGGTAPVGIYEFQGTENKADKVVGLPQFKDADDASDTYVRSLKKDSNGYYTYGDGDIHFDVEHKVWVLGTYGDTSGWYQCDEITSDGKNIFKWHTSADAGDESMNFTLVFDQYVIGDNTETELLGKAGLWL